MENIISNAHYKSGWKPLTREEDMSNILTTYKKKEISSHISQAEADAIKKATEAGSESGSVDIAKTLSELSAKIDALDKRISGQADDLNNLRDLCRSEAEDLKSLLELIKTAAAADKGKKGTLGFSKKLIS
ncbi:MAG: hypothetical protein EOM54_13655 [Clostridia bacterium]|nr:hypothetical protein [Clostridia bacterium]